MIDQPFAIVDLETTGGRAQSHHIIEIAVLRIERGKVVDRFESLVNPGIPIPPFIVQLTAIDDAMVRQAPEFAEVAERVREILEGCIFVAHNVRFDYSFIKQEFARLGQDFQADCLCTVRLSKKLYSNFQRHNLQTLIERFELLVESRHRAMADADAVWQFMQRAHKEIGDETWDQVVRDLLRRPTFPPLLPAEQVESLPEVPGVYVFRNEQGEPLYVGMCKNLRQGVAAHFTIEFASDRQLELSRQVAAVDSSRCFGGLGTRLIELYWIKTLQPRFNRLNRTRKPLIVLEQKRSAKGCMRAALKQVEAIETGGLRKVFSVFRTQRHAEEQVAAIAKKHKLCPQLLGLEKGSGGCSWADSGRCLGACRGAEDAERYNRRFTEAFRQRRLRAWPYPGPVLIDEPAKDAEEGHLILVDQWALKGIFSHEGEALRCFLQPRPKFDYDNYKLFQKHLRRSKVRALTPDEEAALWERAGTKQVSSL